MNKKERDETVVYLRIWRKFYNIKNVSKYFGHGVAKTCKILRKSKRYLESSKRKGRKYKKTTAKDHLVRNQIAIYLKDWKNGYSSSEIAVRASVTKNKILSMLRMSRIFLRLSKKSKKYTRDGQLKIKWSKYRMEVAKALSIWRKTNSIKESAKMLKVSRVYLFTLISRTNAHRRRVSFTRGLNRKETKFVLRWAKKKNLFRIFGEKCCKCGNNDIFVLEFHHVESNKEEIISNLLGLDFSRALKEAKKCIILCRNCHAKEHTNIGFKNELEERIMEKTDKMLYVDEKIRV